MPGYRFVGTVTKRTYTFMANPLVADTDTVVIAGETCVPVTNAGDLARGRKGSPPPTDLYGFTIIPSTWEQQ